MTLLHLLLESRELNRRVNFKLLKFLCLLGLILCFLSNYSYSTVSIHAFLNDANPRKIIIENDSLRISINLDWKLTVNSLKYRPKNIELIQTKYPMPLIGIENRWTLFNVGFGIRNVSIQRTKEISTILIHAYSNYLENPFHIFIQLSIGENPEIKAKIWLENRHKKGFHDIYRKYSDATVVIPGIPWLSFLSPIDDGERRVLYPTPEGYVLEKATERLMEAYRPVYEWEQPPKPESIHLHFLWDPILPTTVEFPERGMGVFLYREKSDLSWHFDSIEKAICSSQTIKVAKGDTFHIFEGVLRIFEGDWHQSYNWFRNRIRKNFDFTYYKGPGYERYRRHFLAYHSFVYKQ